MVRECMIEENDGEHTTHLMIILKSTKEELHRFFSCHEASKSHPSQFKKLLVKLPYESGVPHIFLKYTMEANHNLIDNRYSPGEHIYMLNDQQHHSAACSH